jgi:transcription elongation factor Elf1
MEAKENELLGKGDDSTLTMKWNCPQCNAENTMEIGTDESPLKDGETHNLTCASCGERFGWQFTLTREWPQ